MATNQVTINSLETSDTGPVWVVNSSSPKTGGRGNVWVRVGEEGVTVPMTWVAVNLTEMIDKKSLLGAREFRNAVYRGLLTLISEQEAAELNSGMGAAEEITRIRSLSARGGNNLPSDKNTEPETNFETLSAPVAGVIEAMSNSTDVEVLNTLRSYGTLEYEEYVAVAKHAKAINRGEIRKFCRNAIATLYPDKPQTPQANVNG